MTTLNIDIKNRDSLSSESTWSRETKIYDTGEHVYKWDMDRWHPAFMKKKRNEMQYFVCIGDHPLEVFHKHDNLEDKIYYEPVQKIFSDLINDA